MDRYLSLLARRRRAIVLVVLIATLAVGSGVTAIDGGLAVAEFDVESAASADAEYVDDRFVTDSGSVTLVVVRGENVLTKESLTETLAFQEAVRENETVAGTLSAERPTVDTGTAFTEAQLRSLGAFGSLTLEDKQRTFRTFSSEELETELPETIAADEPVLGPGTSASMLLPEEYDGSARADARLVLIVHEEVDDDELLAAQLAVEAIADERLGSEAFVFGEALVEERASEATGESFAVLGPFALASVLVVLFLAYRDPLDVLVTTLGIGVALVWTAGFVGWVGVDVTQLLVAVPWLVLGLAVDYGLHVVMRYREMRDGGVVAPAPAMTASLGGVLVAIGVTTATTAAGFLSGAFGPTAVREFGLVAAFGIFASFLVFATLVPALKIELEDRLDRDTDRGPVGRVRPVEGLVRLGVVAAGRAPVAVVLVAVVLAIGGAYGATAVDTSVDRTDFYPEEPPAWMSSVPGFETDDDAEALAEQARFLDERFELAGGDDRVTVLIRGAVAEEGGVDAVHAIERGALDSDVVRGEGTVHTPFDVVERFEPFDDRIAEAMADADRTGDGRPDGDVTDAYDATAEIAEAELGALVYRNEAGEYRAVRVVVPVESGADPAVVTEEMRAVAADADERPGVTVTVTGSPIVTADRQAALLRTLVESFLIALAVTFSLLVGLFWHRYRSLRLGLVTVLPVVIALSWVLGTMYLVGLPYNAETAIITGIAIGLGVDYAIHVSVRFEQERRAGERADRDATVAALSRAVRDTGGTLFASAMTTAVALGVLLFTFVPSLQRFGLVMVLVVGYAFIASVFVLPSLLLLSSGER